MTGPCKFNNPLLDNRLIEAGVREPFVSVVVTNYNYGSYITQCLRSIAAQSHANFECFVVDDCSSDGSPELVEQFCASEAAAGRFQLIRHEQNGGQLAGFRTGVARCKAPFVVLVDADDVLLSDFIETHLRFHLGRFTVAFTSSNQYQIDASGHVIGGNHHDLQCQGEYRHVYHRTLHRPYWLWATTSSMMFRKSILDIVMPERTDQLKVCADNYVVHFANLLGGSLLIPSIHGCYRRHGKNCFGSNPVVGGHLPVGDMGKHPEHDTVRRKILFRMLRLHSVLSPIYSWSGFWLMVMRTAHFRELGELKEAFPQVFPKPLLVYQRQYLRYRLWRKTQPLRAFGKNLAARIAG